MSCYLFVVRLREMIKDIIKYIYPADRIRARFNKNFSYGDYRGMGLSETGLFKALHSKNEVLVPWILDGLGFINAKKGSASLSGFKILEVGCGIGILATALAIMGGDITGIDYSRQAVEIAHDLTKLEYPSLLKTNLKFLLSTPDTLDVTPNDRYDVIIASNIMQDFEDISEFVFNCVHLSKPNGMVYFTPINNIFTANFLSRFAPLFIAMPAHNDVKTGHNFVNSLGLKKYLSLYHFTDIQEIGFTYKPLTNHWSTCNVAHLNYGLRGRKSNNELEYIPGRKLQVTLRDLFLSQ